jgi:signal transduction histidine kinase
MTQMQSRAVHRAETSDGPHAPEAAPRGFWRAATQVLFGVIGVALITFAAVRLELEKLPPPISVGPGTISLLYLIVVVLVSLRAGFVSSAAVALMAAFSLSYFFLPLFSSLRDKNPLDILATVAYLFTAWVITGSVARVRRLTEAQLAESRRAEEELQRSFRQLRELAARLQSVREEERAMVAREIHDELGQALTAIKIDLASLIGALRVDQQEELEKAESILRLIDQTILSVRRIATELRPGILDDLGLVAAVEWAAQEFKARTGTKCNLDLPDDDIVIDQERTTAIFRIFQETLTNVTRHAEATRVDVRLGRENGNIVLEVRDNGRGIAEERLSRSRSLGILGMRERALLLGGELTISGAPGKGTIVRVLIPEIGG